MEFEDLAEDLDLIVILEVKISLMTLLKEIQETKMFEIETLMM